VGAPPKTACLDGKLWGVGDAGFRALLLFNLRCDPFEKANLESGEYEKCHVERMFVMTGRWRSWRRTADLQRLPPASEANSFSIGDAMEKLMRRSL
jgi:hypothetical protein